MHACFFSSSDAKRNDSQSVITSIRTFRYKRSICNCNVIQTQKQLQTHRYAALVTTIAKCKSDNWMKLNSHSNRPI